MNEQTPHWVQDGKVNEVAFCEAFLQDRNILWSKGSFFTEEGKIRSEDILRKEIYERIRPYVTSRVSTKVEHILAALRLAAQKNFDGRQELVIHTANGAYNIDQRQFYPEKVCCRCRLPVAYNADAPAPKLWLQFLEELLEKEDIPTLQEYLGYCLLPITYGQKMMMIIGQGGEGKSRIGVVMKALMGDNMNMGSIAKVETNAFARADLENALLMVDDDLKMEALSQTHYLKSIITAEVAMDLERKGIQSYQGQLYVRFLAFGNGSLQALHDRSFGFFRRQIILTAKPRAQNRVDDPYLGKRLAREAEGIFLWCLEGLHRLVEQDFQFTLSYRATENLFQSMCEGNNIIGFLGSEGYFRYDPTGGVSSRKLYSLYQEWCEDNSLVPLSTRSFWSYLCQHAGEYQLRHTNTIPIGNGKRARGFYGLRPLSGM